MDDRTYRNQTNVTRFQQEEIYELRCYRTDSSQGREEISHRCLLDLAVVQVQTVGLVLKAKFEHGVEESAYRRRKYH